MTMKKTNIAVVVLFVAAFVAGSLFIAGAGVSAQVTTPVACSFTLPSVPAGESATVTATGGDGNYVWSSPGLNITNATGASFSVTFNAPGTYPVTVTSAGVSSTC